MFAFLKSFFSTATEPPPPPEPLPAHPPPPQPAEFRVAPLPETTYAVNLAAEEAAAAAPAPAAIGDLPPEVQPVTLAEQAACRWAAGDGAGVRALLAAAGAALCPTTWAMRFELERLAGDRAAFEALAVEFARREEKSPPSWDLAANTALAVAGTLAIGPDLTAGAAGQLDQMLRSARGAQQVTLDLSSVQDFDEAGCRLFLDRLMRLRRLGIAYRLTGFDRLEAMLQGSIEPGVRLLPWLWRMLMEIVQARGDRQRFEALATEYIALFEESPPSWEEAPPLVLVSAPRVEPARHDYALSGEVLAASGDTFAPLVALAESRAALTVDLSGLTRMDYASAAALAEVLFRLSRRGIRLQASGVSPLVEPMLQLAGVARYALVSVRRLK